MSTATNEVAIKAIAGNLFMKDVAPLTPKEDGTPRHMGVIHIQTNDGVVRITDFSKQHEALVEGQPVKVVFEETQQMRGERLVTYRNLQSAVQR